MRTTKLTSSVDFADIVVRPDSYIIIEEDILLDPEDFSEFTDLKGNITVKVAKNCVFDFRGGSLKIDASAAAEAQIRSFNLNLNGAQVSAASYCIFYGITVSGFENTEVKAEWFNTGDYSNGWILGGEEVYINRAIVAANGCPVVLEKRQYNLKNSIIFPYIGQDDSQTLISPGTLEIAGGGAAIDIRTHNINLSVNLIIGVVNHNAENISSGKYFTGTGIKFSGPSAHSNIEIQCMKWLHNGIAIVPDIKNSVSDTDRNAGIQYCKISFQKIRAYNCVYIDPFSKTDWIIDENGEHPTNWFSESQITGGKLEGFNGIYYEEPDEAHNGFISMDGVVFNNIGLEGLEGLPLRLRNFHFCKFLNLRMNESLPGFNDLESTAPWIDMENIKNVEISVKGYLRPKHYDAENNVNNVVLRGNVLDNGWIHDHLDTLVFMTMPKAKLEKSGYGRKPVRFATSSIQPYNMVKTIDVGDPASTLLQMQYCTLDDLFPITHPTAETGSGFDKIRVLPRLVIANINNGSKLTVDLAGFDRFVPGFFEMKINLNASGTLVFTVDKPDPDNGNSLNIVGSQTDESGNQYLPIKKSGNYHIELNASFDIVISKIS